MIYIPEILDGAIDFDAGDELKLKAGATPQQKQAFKEFMHELKQSNGCVEFEDPFDKDSVFNVTPL